MIASHSHMTRAGYHLTGGGKYMIQARIYMIEAGQQMNRATSATSRAGKLTTKTPRHKAEGQPRILNLNECLLAQSDHIWHNLARIPACVPQLPAQNVTNLSARTFQSVLIADGQVCFQM